MQNRPENIISCLLASAQIRANKIVYTIPGNDRDALREITYQELETAVRKVASLLINKQLKDQPVLLVYEDILHFIVSFLACQFVGIIPVPVPYAKGSKQLLRINGIIEDAGAHAILCIRDSVVFLQEELNSGLPVIPTDAHLPADEHYLQMSPSFTEISFIQYTSGSVSKPKGVVVTHHNLINNQQLIQQTFGCDEHSVIFSWLPFHHDMGLIGNILHTIYAGCSGVLMSPLQFVQQPLAWLQGISTYKATHSGAPNFAYDLCVNRININEHPSLDLSSWKVAYNGSEPVQAATLQRFADYFKTAGFQEQAFAPCYGLAEATLLVAGIKAAEHYNTVYIDQEAGMRGEILLAAPHHKTAKPVVSAGYPADGMQLKIASLSNGNICGELEQGEICISGKSVTAGYWNKDNSDLFYEYDGEKFLRTGDLGFLYQGALFVTGREKEMLIIRGKNYYPYDLEQAVSGCDKAIERNGVAVFALDAPDNAFVMVAEIKRTAIRELDDKKIITTLNNHLTELFGISPHDILLVTPLDIPRTTSGKLQRIKCRERYRQNEFNVISSMLALTAKVKQRTLDPQLCGQVRLHASYETIRAYVTGLIASKIDGLLPAIPDDNADITELGVDSLRAMEIINIINKDLDINLDATGLYRYNTLSALCNIIETMLWLKTEQSSGKEIII